MYELARNIFALFGAAVAAVIGMGAILAAKLALAERRERHANRRAAERKALAELAADIAALERGEKP